MELNHPKQPTGSVLLDSLLNGGYERSIITTYYGPPGSGKTLITTLASISCAQQNKKVIYIDTEGGFSVERVNQLTKNPLAVLERLIFLRPTNFDEQRETFDKLRQLVGTKDNVSLIIVDSMTMLYRLELGKNDNVYEVNKELGMQLGYLLEVAEKKCIPVIVTNQVYSDFEHRDAVKMVGGDILHYWSKCLIELQILPSTNRRATVRKARSISEGRNVMYRIVHSGIESAKEKKWIF